MTTIDEWQFGKQYGMRDFVVYNGVIYMCQMSHSSLRVWNPSRTSGALWREADAATIQKFHTESESEKLKQENARLQAENEKLMEENTQLSEHIKSMPDGQDFFEAKAHYESMASKQSES